MTVNLIETNGGEIERLTRKRAALDAPALTFVKLGFRRWALQSAADGTFPRWQIDVLTASGRVLDGAPVSD